MGLYENMKSEPVKRLALRDPVLVPPTATLREAILAMRQKRLGCAIVIDQQRKPLGMFTEGQLTPLLARSGPEILDQPVSRHMADQWPWVQLQDPIVDVLEAMQVRNVRFLCVVDDQGVVHAVTGQKGLMEYVAEHFPREVMVQRIGEKPYLQKREGA